MNSFGINFRVALFGESHGVCAGVMIDGCPPGIKIEPNDFEEPLSRRRGGKRKGTTPRSEEDKPEFLSGIHEGYTTGSPIVVITRNKNTVSSAYNKFKDIPRPGHADFVAAHKYHGYADMRGSGHFSGRLTYGLVVAGVFARKILSDIKVSARIVSVGGSEDIEPVIDNAILNNDSVGAIVECKANGVPIGLGEPFFYSIESAISQIAFSIPGIKGIEFGSGFRAANMLGSEHNDTFVDKYGRTRTNNAGGINGGISNGNEILFRVGVKPTSSIGVEQETYDFSSDNIRSLKIEGRHDACIALRMPVILESATYIALADMAAF